MKPLLAIGSAAVLSTALKFEWLPPFWMFLLLFAVMGVDFATGIIKAWIKREVRTSAGYRRTASKLTQYSGGIFLSIVMTFCSMLTTKPLFKVAASFSGDAFLWFLIFSEFTSILENLYAIDSTSKVSVYVFQPMLKACTFQFRNNPLFKVEQMEAQSNTNTHESS